MSTNRLADGLSDGGITVNQNDSMVHFIDRGMILVTPLVFKAYTNGFFDRNNPNCPGLRAKQGNLKGALASVDSWKPKNASEVPLFECRMASIYAAVGDRHGFVDAMQRSYDASNNDPSRALDLAMAHSRFGDVVQARLVLDTIDRSLIPSFGIGFVSWAQGLCDARQGLPGATQALAQGVAAFLKLSDHAAVWTALAFCTADHCMALALDGHGEQARRQFAKVWPIVKVHADEAFMDQLRSAGLLKGLGP